jgi:hypothetical protein
VVLPNSLRKLTPPRRTIKRPKDFKNTTNNTTNEEGTAIGRRPRIWIWIWDIDATP